MTKVIKKVKTIARRGLAGSILCIAATIPSFAQQAINSIEVLVNDKPLSSFDINQRLRLVVAVSGGVKSEQEFLKVREQVIRSMVDELLQLEEARTVDLTVPQAQLDSFFERRAQGLNQTANQLEQALIGIGSSKTSMQRQMEAEIAWSQLVEGRLGSFVSVSEEEVEARIQKIFDNRGKFEYRLAEIILDVNASEQEASVKANGQQIVERIRSGASFPDVAQQLSSSPTAAVGGDLGWLTVDALDSHYAKIAQEIAVGDVTDPIRTAGGFVILALRDRRRILVADPLDEQVALRQLFLTKPATEDAAKTAKFEAVAENLHTETIACKDLQAKVDESGADGPIEVGVFRLRDLQGPIRTTVESLEADQASSILKMEDGWRVIVVCEKQAPQVQEPDFDLIHDQIEQQRLSMMGRRYLRDLRRDAIVDYR